MSADRGIICMEGL